MRKLIASTMVSLDGVMQAPGGPQEDPAGSFAFGGWTFPYWDDAPDRPMNGLDGKDRELLLGRRTYEIFEAYWPYQPADDPIAKTFNATKKHVASRTLKTLGWNNSTLLRGDVVAAVAALKAQPGLDLQIIGSGNLIQTLQAASLIEEYKPWAFPVVLGHGWPSSVPPTLSSSAGAVWSDGIRTIAARRSDTASMTQHGAGALPPKPRVPCCSGGSTR